MRRQTTLYGLFLILTVLVSHQVADGAIIKEVVVFGDSLSDTGNLFAFTSSVAPPAFPPGPAYFQGRFSNGPVWVEILAQQLGVAIPAPSLVGGTNYAWGGAEAGNGASFRLTPNIGAQISGGFPGNPGFLESNNPRDDQLFVIWGGANNFNNAGSLPSPADVAQELANHVSTLAAAGAKKFLVPNQGRLGQLPRHKGTASEAIFDNAALQFNTALEAQLQSLENAFPTIKIHRLDVESLLDEVLSNPAKFGFTNTTGTAKVIGDTTNNANFFDPRIVANPNEYVWFDDVHPTQATHAIIGQAAAETVVPEPTSMIMWFLGAGLLGAFWRRKR